MVAYQKDPSIISVTGFGADGKTKIAVGCAQTMIDQATISVPIKMERVVPSHTCGNNIVEPTETCDDTTIACNHITCQTIEEVLSYGDPKAGTSTGTAGQKTNPFLLWGAGTGGDTDSAGVMMVVYTDASSGAGDQITARFMDDTMGPLASLYGPVAAESSVFVPNSAKLFPSSASTNDEKDPSAATIGNVDYVVYSSDAPVAKAGATRSTSTTTPSARRTRSRRPSTAR